MEATAPETHAIFFPVEVPMAFSRVVAVFTFTLALAGCQGIGSGVKLAPAGSGATTPPASNGSTSGGSGNGSGSGATGGGGTGTPEAEPALFYVEVLNGTGEQLYGVSATPTSVSVTPGSPFGPSSSGYSGLSAAAGFLFAADASSIQAWSIDPTSGAITQTAQVPQPTKFIGGLAADPKGQFLYEPSGEGDSSGDFVYAYSVASNGSLAALTGSPFRVKSPVLGTPQTTVISRDGQWLCVSEYHGSPDSAILCDAIDPNDGALNNGMEAGVGNQFSAFAFLQPSYLAVSAGGWSHDWVSGTGPLPTGLDVLSISAQGLQLVSSVPNIRGYLAASKDGSRLVATATDGTLRLFAFDAASNQIQQIDETACPNSPYNGGFVAVSPNGDYVAAACGVPAGSVSLYRTAAGKFQEITGSPLPLEPGGAAMAIVAAQ